MPDFCGTHFNQFHRKCVWLDFDVSKLRNIKSRNSFYKAGKLKTVTIQGNVKSVGKNAFAGINKKAVIKIKTSNSNYKKIVKLIKKSGAPKTVTYKRVK